MRVLALVLLLSVPLSAQEPVREVPDIVSWGTALVNPVIAVIRAWRSDDPKCQFSQLVVTGGIAATGILAQKFITSPRPCRGSAGCDGNGWPSMHSVWANVGVTHGAQTGMGITATVTMAVGTPMLRWAANRHTDWQAVAGALWGTGAELGGRALVRCGP